MTVTWAWEIHDDERLILRQWQTPINKFPICVTLTAQTSKVLETFEVSLGVTGHMGNLFNSVDLSYIRLREMPYEPLPHPLPPWLVSAWLGVILLVAGGAFVVAVREATLT